MLAILAASRETVVQAWQLRDFIKSGHQSGNLIDHITRKVIDHLTKDTFRPARTIVSTVRDQRSRSRSASVDPLADLHQTWPEDWAIDKASIRTSVRTFQEATTQIRRLFDPPSTGNTPEASTSPQGQQASDQSGSRTPTRSPSNPQHSSGTSQTSADESIRRRSNSGMAETQSSNAQGIDIETVIANAIARYIRENPPVQGLQGPPGPPGDPGAAGAAAATGNNGTPRFQANDVGFFDPFYDGKSSDTGAGIEHAGKDTYFRDVTIFIDRIKDVARVKGSELLRNNLQICLRGEALEWYTCQLTDNEKRLLTYGNNCEEWSSALLERFGPTKASGMATIVKEKYTLNDAMRHREPREYAMAIIRAAKVAKLGDVHNQLDIIWNGLDVEFQSDIDPPTIQTTLNQFLTSMDIRKQQWWTKASRVTKHNPGSQHSSQRTSALPLTRSNQSQYNTQARNSRPANSGFQNSGFQNSGRSQPSYPYQQNYQAYNQYQNRPSNYQSSGPAYQGPRRDQPALPAPPVQRQITAGPNVQPNAYGSRQPLQPTSGNQPGRAPPYQYERHPYQATRGSYPQRAYQTSVEEPGDFPEESRPDPHHDPESFHGDYQDFPDENPEEYSSFPDPGFEPEVNFVSSPSTVHPCQLCKQTFGSRNSLFRHLKQECWKKLPTESSDELSEVPVTTHSVTEELPRVVESATQTSPRQGLGTAFRGYQHTKADARFSPDSKDYEVCLDPGCPITLGDRALLATEIHDFEKRVQKQAPIPVRGYGNKITHATEYIVIDLYFPGTLGNDRSPALAKIPLEVHLTENLRANMLIGTDVLTPHQVLLDCSSGSQSATIVSCENIKISARTVVSPFSQVKRTVRTKSAITLPPKSVLNVSISYASTLPEDRDFLFEPELPASYNLGTDGGVFAHVVDSSMTFVQARNSTEAPVTLPRRTRVGTVVEYSADGCYQTSYKSAGLAACGWRTSDRSGVSTMNATTTIDTNLEHVLPNGVTVYGNEEAFNALSAIVAEFDDVFTDSGSTIDLPEDQWMPIPVKPGTKPKPSKVYPIGQKDREVVDATFDKLQQQGKLRFSTQPTPYSWPCFVVWRDTPQGRKGRVVIDIRGLNEITEDDAYPLPLQADMIALIAGYPYIATVDGVAWFHQFNVQRPDRKKLTIISHRGQEESSVALMGYKGSPPYVQRQTDAILRPLRDFVRAFVDDIIVFSKTLEEHVSHLRQLFQLLRERRASLSPGKSFLGFPSVTLLGQRVDSLGMSTSEEKVKAITALRFPSSLRDLEIFLGLTGWLRNSIPRYAQRAQPLQERKTALTQAMISETPATITEAAPDGSEAATTKAKKQLTGPTRKRKSLQLRYDPTEQEVTAFRDLQESFRAPTFLAHFDRKRKLYIDIDASKVWGFAAMVYHVKGEKGILSKADVQPILFLSKSINAAERNYWPTELEVAAIVWVVRKVRHMIEASEASPVIIYTDHSAAVQIARQTTLSTSSTDKLNLRLVRASQYLSGFNLSIRHKAGKKNVVPDALSRLQGIDEAPQEKQAVLESLYGTPVELSEQSAITEPTLVHHMTLVEMSDDFKARLIKAYDQDAQWKKVLDLLKQPESELPAGFRFRKHDDLIYLTSEHPGKRRLCIPESLEKEVFQLAHDGNFHAGFHTTYARISPSVYIRGLSKHLHIYLKHCPECQLNQTKRHPTYGELNPIATPPIPFHTIAIDFIVALPYWEGMNMLLTCTCKFTKKKLLVPGFDEWNTENWANTFLVALTSHDWGIPVAIISDRDSKFMSDFWKAIFRRLGTTLATSTAYHPQTDGQSERTNQTVEIALRFHLTTGTNDWLSVLPFLQASLNNSVTSVTGFAPNELVYGFRVRDTLGLLADLPPEDFNQLRLIKREEADDALAFVNAISKARYDHSHMSMNLAEGSQAYLRLHHGYSIPGVNPKLSNQRVGPFPVLEKVGNLAYRLELPGVMRIHPVISIAQLEPSPDRSEDPYHRTSTQPVPPVEETQDNLDPDFTTQYRPYVIERLLDRRGTGRNVKYLVKWEDHGNEHNVWYPVHALQEAKDLMAECDARLASDPTKDRRERNRQKKQELPPTQKKITQAKTRGRPRKLNAEAKDSGTSALEVPPSGTQGL